MKIIISPAKTMVAGSNEYYSLPVYLPKSQKLLAVLKNKSNQQLKKIWQCNDELVKENIDRLKNMDLENGLTAAIYCYQGLVFKNINVKHLNKQQLAYLNKHLRILSGFYGVVKPFDGIREYRLEMASKLAVEETKNLYDYWKDDLYKQVNDDVIINLASNEYSKCINKYLGNHNHFITISFMMEKGGKLTVKGTYAKMARGAMVSYLAENMIEDSEDIKKFKALDFSYRADLSDDNNYVFVRRE